MKIVTDELELRKPCENVKLYEMKGLIKIMPSVVKTMRDGNGCGLAAPQIGMSKTFFIANVRGRTRLFINPSIIEYSKDVIVEEEGCLSFPGLVVSIERSKSVKMSFFDYSLKKRTTEIFTGEGARVIQHEYDHLKGIICVLDKAIIFDEKEEAKLC